MSHKYVAPWQKCDYPTKIKLKHELLLEMCEEHPLFGCNFEALAYRPDKNQVLFRIVGGVFDFAVVYLTMKSCLVEESEPDVDFYISHEEWVDRCMRCPI